MKLKNYKKLLIIPILLVLISFLFNTSYSRYESHISYSLINGKVSKRVIYAKDVIINNSNAQDIIDELSTIFK